MTKNNEINLLLLGSSGAGKSSFAKTFLLHSNFIDASGDGQTTRSNIIYDLKLYNDEPQVEINFLSKTDFLNRLYHASYHNYLVNVINLIYKKLNKKNIDKLEEFLIDDLNDYIREIIKGISSNDKCSLQKKISLSRIYNNQLKDETERLKDFINISDINQSNQNEIKLQKIKSCEKMISRLLRDKLSCSTENFIKDNKVELIQYLSNVDGFFNIEEFKLYFDNYRTINKSSCRLFEDDNIFDYSSYYGCSKNDKFEDLFFKYYTNAYDQIIRLLYEMHILGQGESLKFIIKLSDQEKLTKIVSFCLQVKDKMSLTGVVDFVHIKDSISNEYSFIIDDLCVSNFRIIDTYGIDHSDINNNQNQALSDILYSLQDKNIVYFDSNLAVIYIKKLDAGKPTELKTIIPQLYKLLPQSPIYCVLNGIDIFLGNQIDTFNGFESHNLRQNKPKSMEYLKSEQFRKDLNHVFQNSNNLLEFTYGTLINNIVTFCSKKSIINNKPNILIHNREGIYKLISSISMKEYSSLQIISKDFTDYLQLKDIDDKIEKFLENVFKYASLTDWEPLHRNTIRANYEAINVDGKLGYWGKYQHRWNQLFHKGYAEAVSEESNLLKVDGGKYTKYIPAIDSCIKNMEQLFFGDPHLLFIKDIQDNEKEEFRKIIEKMYYEGTKEKNNYIIYKYNPFISRLIDKEQRISYLNDVCNFYKGFQLIKADLILHFKSCLIKQIYLDNNAKVENILKLNYDFYAQFRKIEYDFRHKYSNIDFAEFLSYYSANIAKHQ